MLMRGIPQKNALLAPSGLDQERGLFSTESARQDRWDIVGYGSHRHSVGVLAEHLGPVGCCTTMSSRVCRWEMPRQVGSLDGCSRSDVITCMCPTVPTPTG